MRQNYGFILGSASPQRHHLIEQLGISFRTIIPNSDERAPGITDPELLVKTLALEKQRLILEESDTINLKKDVLLTADTLVFLSGVALGKPQSRTEALEFLTLLSGKEHQVKTGIAVKTPLGDKVMSVSTQVIFSQLSEIDIHWYLESAEWQGAAGAYRIQGCGAALISHIHGSHTNVVGLPLQEIYGILRSINFWE